MNNKAYITCFGEVLWDIFPSGSRAGGAPFNVAYHVHKMGTDVAVLSRTGNDDLGNSLRKKISGWNISTDFLQRDNDHPTGTVIARIDEHNEAIYDIVDQVAWDYIEFLPIHKNLVSNAKALIYGSLSSRNEKTRETLLQLLNVAKLKIFDVNLRAPFIDKDLIKILLNHADIVKMNSSELKQITAFSGLEFDTEDKAVQFIKNEHNIKEVVLTKGSYGASYFTDSWKYSLPALPITIADTVGSGDAFLAGFISGRIRNEHPEKILTRAMAMGAFITSQEGACPDYDYSDFEKFMTEKSVQKTHRHIPRL